MAAAGIRYSPVRTSAAPSVRAYPPVPLTRRVYNCVVRRPVLSFAILLTIFAVPAVLLPRHLSWFADRGLLPVQAEAVPWCYQPEGEPIRLWPAGKVPGALGDGPYDTPILRPMVPAAENSSEASMLILPGGGYERLSEQEGATLARWFCGMGVASYVLMYRLGSHGYHHPSMLQDAQRAMRVLRGSVLRSGIDDRHRIGVIGSSAGGHLAASLLAYNDPGISKAEDPVEKQGCKPDVGILLYPVISMDDAITHKGSKKALLGQSPDPKLVDYFSIERHVTSDYPPTFMFHARDDPTVSVDNAVRMEQALKKAQIPHAVHLYDKGGHGGALGTKTTGPKGPFHPWTLELKPWLVSIGFLKEQKDSNGG